MALEYAKRGAKLVLVARRENRLREVADECMDCGAKDAAVCRADISLPEDCKRIVDFALDTFGRCMPTTSAQPSLFTTCFYNYIPCHLGRMQS